MVGCCVQLCSVFAGALPPAVTNAMHTVVTGPGDTAASDNSNRVWAHSYIGHVKLATLISCASCIRRIVFLQLFGSRRMAACMVGIDRPREGRNLPRSQQQVQACFVADTHSIKVQSLQSMALCRHVSM